MDDSALPPVFRSRLSRRSSAATRPSVPSSSTGEPLAEVAAAVRLQGRDAEFDGLPLPRRVAGAAHSPLFLPDGADGTPGRTAAKTDTDPKSRGRRLPRTDLAPGRRSARASPASSSSCPCWPASASTASSARAGYPGSEMVPAARRPAEPADLKLLDKERRSHINDFNFDEALGLFAGLNILPKKSFATDYSYRTDRGPNSRRCWPGWVPALAPLLFPEAAAFSLDFHPIPYRGDAAGLENHYLPLPRQGRPQRPDLLRPGAGEPRACAMPTPT